MARARGPYMTKIDYELDDQDRTRSWLTKRVNEVVDFTPRRLTSILDEDGQATYDEQIEISRALRRRRSSLFLQDGCARMRDRDS